tara:strand:+ start:1866 stop:4082 length:2217 start_codon:yes stop_codon:yes gene_type:complete
MRYNWLSLNDVLRSVPAMDRYHVSEVARGVQPSKQTKEGFVEAYIASNGSISKMKKRLTGRNNHETWSDRRNQFIARHLEQMRANDTYSTGWTPKGEPTRRHLGLIAWAYSPSPKRLKKWLDTQAPLSSLEWKRYVSNPPTQLSFDFTPKDPYLTDLDEDMVQEVVFAVRDREDKEPTVVIGSEQRPKSDGITKAIKAKYLQVVKTRPHGISGVTIWEVKPTRRGFALVKKRRDIMRSLTTQLQLFAANPSYNEDAEFVSSHDIVMMEPPHQVDDTSKLKSIIKSLLQNGWVGRPLLSLGEGNLLTGSHRYGAIKKIVEEYEDSENDDFIERVEEVGLSEHDNTIPLIDIAQYLSEEDIEELEWLPDEEQKIEYLSTVKDFPSEILNIYKLEQSPKSNPTKSLTVPIHFLSSQGIHEKIGHVILTDTNQGLRIDTSLSQLPQGYHGTHIHEYGDLSPSKKGDKWISGGSAGSHYDPDNAGYHGSPTGNGHKGDLPRIFADDYGESNQTLYAPRLKLSEIEGRSIVIHRYGDNYSDHPLPNGGGKERMAGGIIKKHCAYCKKNPVVRDKRGLKIPQKYLSGYEGKELEKRIKEIESRRIEYDKALEKYGDESKFPQKVMDQLYRPFITDQNKKSRKSPYTVEAHKRGFDGDLKDKSKAASKYYGDKVPESVLKDVFDRGVGAWASGGHRPAQTPESWGYARVNSFLVGGKTFFTSDNDLANKLPKRVYNKIEKQRTWKK